MTETPEDRPATRIRAWFRRRLDTPLKQAGAALGAAVVVGAVAGTAWFVLTGDDGGEKTAFVDPPGFALSPEGDDVPRLTPVRVTFASAPGERSGEKLLVLEPGSRARTPGSATAPSCSNRIFPGCCAAAPTRSPSRRVPRPG